MTQRRPSVQVPTPGGTSACPGWDCTLTAPGPPHVPDAFTWILYALPYPGEAAWYISSWWRLCSMRGGHTWPPDALLSQVKAEARHSPLGLWPRRIYIRA